VKTKSWQRQDDLSAFGQAGNGKMGENRLVSSKAFATPATRHPGTGTSELWNPAHFYKSINAINKL
jgi:hypothetical protein